MSLRENYFPVVRLCHEVRILLALLEREEDGPDTTGMFQYQQDKIYELIDGVDEGGSFPEDREAHLPSSVDEALARLDRAKAALPYELLGKLQKGRGKEAAR